MNKRIGNRNKLKKWLIALVFAMMISPLIGGTQVKAAEDTPKAWITPYVSEIKADATKRTSRLYEVKTSGFAKEAYLEYKYYNNLEVEYKQPLNIMGTYRMDQSIEIFQTNRTYEYADVAVGNPCSHLIRRTWTSDFLHDFRFFAVRIGEIAHGNVIITVKDVNKNSKTYDKTAQTTFTDAATSDMSTDMNKGVGTMWVGETKQELRLLLASAGMPMEPEVAYSYYSITDKVYFINQAEGTSMSKVETKTGDGTRNDYKYTITANQTGSSTLNVGHDRYNASPALFDPYYENIWFTRRDFPMTYGSFDIYAFDRPAITTTPRKVIVNNTKEGITYTLGYESFTCTEDGQEIVFGKEEGTDGFLMPGGTFQIELSKKVNGKTAKIIENAVTNGFNHVTMNPNGVTPDTPLGTIELKYQEEELGERVLTAPGYTLEGWNTQPDGTGVIYTDKNIVMEEYLTLYAQWYKKHYKADITLNLDKKLMTTANVGLYQDGKEIYKLKHSTTNDGHYIGEDIEYSKYAADDGAYDIYVDGVDSGVDYKLSGREVDKTTVKANVNMFDAKVGLKYNDANWKDQKVVLSKDGVEYITQYNDISKTYNYRLLYGIDKPKDGDYLIYVNDKLMQSPKEIEKIVISDDLDKNRKDYSYYDVEMDVKKDDAAWDKAEVTLRQNSKKLYTMEYDGLSEKYKINGIVDFGQAYDVFIKGSNSTDDVNIQLSFANKSDSKNYYSVEFKDESNIFNTQIILSNTSARKPSIPYKVGSTFKSWNMKEDGTGENPFKAGANVTPPIKKATSIYSIWQEPQLKLGSILRCDENGTKNGKGKYYRFANIAITGFPTADKDTPILTAEFISKDSKINALNVPADYKVQGDGTDKITIYFKPGIKMSVAEEYLSKNIIVQPKAAPGHNLKGRVFGVTG